MFKRFKKTRDEFEETFGEDYEIVKGTGRRIKSRSFGIGNLSARFFKRLGIGAFIFFLIITIVSLYLFAAGLFPCVIGVVIGVVFCGLTLMQIVAASTIEEFFDE